VAAVPWLCAVLGVRRACVGWGAVLWGCALRTACALDTRLRTRARKFAPAGTGLKRSSAAPPLLPWAWGLARQRATRPDTKHQHAPLPLPLPPLRAISYSYSYSYSFLPFCLPAS